MIRNFEDVYIFLFFGVLRTNMDMKNHLRPPDIPTTLMQSACGMKSKFLLKIELCMYSMFFFEALRTKMIMEIDVRP